MSNNIIFQDENTTRDVFSQFFDESRTLKCITVGRANVDFYPPVGERLDSTRTYDVFVGGSPANIAVGLAKLQVPVGIITRVADDLHGTFAINYLKSFGIDVSQVQYDTSGAKTSLAFAERCVDANVIMYRNNVADLMLQSSQISKDYIASAACVFVSGTALTQEPSRTAILQTLEYAQETNTLCAMDIDYRPYGWESFELASEVMTKAASLCDIIVGTREEFAIANTKIHSEKLSSDITDYMCAEHLLKNKAKLVVVKRGELGSIVFVNVNDKIEEMEGFMYPVELVKPYGAGDAFASSLLGHLSKGKSIEFAMSAGAASASINISGDSCTEAMPTEQEIIQFLSKTKT